MEGDETNSGLCLQCVSEKPELKTMQLLKKRAAQGQRGKNQKHYNKSQPFTKPCF